LSFRRRRNLFVLPALTDFFSYAGSFRLSPQKCHNDKIGGIGKYTYRPYAKVHWEGGIKFPLYGTVVFAYISMGLRQKAFSGVTRSVG
jgi:hypothetical protein